MMTPYTVLLLGLLAFSLLLASAVDQAWVTASAETTYIGASGEQKKGTGRGTFGLSEATLASPTYDDVSKTEFDLKMVYPVNVAIKLNSESNKQSNGPEAVSWRPPGSKFPKDISHTGFLMLFAVIRRHARHRPDSRCHGLCHNGYDLHRCALPWRQ